MKNEHVHSLFQPIVASILQTPTETNRSLLKIHIEGLIMDLKPGKNILVYGAQTAMEQKWDFDDTMKMIRQSYEDNSRIVINSFGEDLVNLILNY